MKSLSTYIKEAASDFFRILTAKREKGSFVASDSLYRDALEAFGENATVINPAYTDYGGTIMDRATIEWYKENEPDKIVWEETSYHGQNAICLPVEGMKNENYFYDVEGLEDVYYEVERQLQEESAKYFCDEHDCHEMYDDVLAWIESNGSTQATDIDFDWEKLEEAMGVK